MPQTPDVDLCFGATADAPSGVRMLPRHRLALIAGTLCLGMTLVLNVPGVTELRRYPSPAMALSHVAMALIALGLSPHFPAWVGRVATLSARQRRLGLLVALVGPLALMTAILAVAPTYGHALVTREWGIIEPLQFVLWLTAAWLAFERARCEAPGSAGRSAFRMAAGGGILLAIEEVDYLGVGAVVAKAVGLPKGRIAGQYVGGLHDVVNALGKISLVFALLALAVVAALLFAWFFSRGLHRAVGREIFSATALPLVGTVVFMAVAQLSDIDQPVLAELFGHVAIVRSLREEPMELLAVICVNASLLAKLIPHLRPVPTIRGPR